MPEYTVTIDGERKKKTVVVLFATDASEARRVGERHGTVIDVERHDGGDESYRELSREYRSRAKKCAA